MTRCNYTTRYKSEVCILFVYTHRCKWVLIRLVYSEITCSVTSQKPQDNTGARVFGAFWKTKSLNVFLDALHNPTIRCQRPVMLSDHREPSNSLLAVRGQINTVGRLDAEQTGLSLVSSIRGELHHGRDETRRGGAAQSSQWKF